MDQVPVQQWDWLMLLGCRRRACVTGDGGGGEAVLLYWVKALTVSWLLWFILTKYQPWFLSIIPLWFRSIKNNIVLHLFTANIWTYFPSWSRHSQESQSDYGGHVTSISDCYSHRVRMKTAESKCHSPIWQHLPYESVQNISVLVVVRLF